jgi:glycosyltransferase involved in cell wall biosynthesis
MYKDRRIAVVVPAYNEARYIGQVLSTVPDYVDYVIPVDDCSSDETFAVIAAARDGRVSALRMEENQGVGGATLSGYARAPSSART